MTLNEARERAIISSKDGGKCYIIIKPTYDNENDTYVIEKDGYDTTEWYDSSVVEKYIDGERLIRKEAS